MSYSRRANNLGLSTNIGLESSAISSSNPNINNNIVINTKETNSETNANLSNPYANSSVSNFIPPTSSLTEDNLNLEMRLLDIYTQILLSDNKKLLANIVSKQNIIISKTDLESIISLLINKKVSIELEDPDVSCLSRISNSLDFGKVSAIKIIDENCVTDFKLVHNKEYNELINKYHLSLKFVLL